MGSIKRRIEALEARWGMDEDREARERRTEARRELMIARLNRVMAQAGQEELENPSEASRRRAALEEFQESIERRRRGA
jgi:hypothetical protein